MRLLASLMNEDRWHELLTEIDATSDTAERVDEMHVCRRITGTIRRRGPIWNAYVTFWRRVAASGIATPFPHLASGEVDGRPYFMAKLLDVDQDEYRHQAWINVEGDTIQVILYEMYDDDIAGYADHVCERNSNAAVRNTIY
jgi:hypothetical protein